MGRTFQYIKNEDVLKSFIKYKDSLLDERAVVIARHGDYSLFLEKESDKILRLSIKNTVRDTEIRHRTYNIDETTDSLVERGTRHACQKMEELSDEDVNRRRLQVWKWYLLEWQMKNPSSTSELVQQEMQWSEDMIEGVEEVMDMESFLHGAYLNLGNTLSLIDKYMAGDDERKERFRTFVINDIMEMTGEDTKDKSIAEAESRGADDDLVRHTYKFTVSVEATDHETARKALLRYLAGDERIKVQK